MGGIMRKSYIIPLAVVLLFCFIAHAADVVPTDIMQPGTQPGEIEKLLVVDTCNGCHGEYDLDGLNAYLKRVKATFPDQLAVTLLLEAEVDYEALVQVMDAVRTYRVDEPGNFSRAELFPEISIGDAPLLAQGR